MKLFTPGVVLGVVLGGLICLSAPPLQVEDLQAAEIDPGSGLIKADGWELVNAHCGACHSHRLVTQQRGDAEFWLSTIRWMQRTQNLWDIPGSQEQTLIDYLSEHYNETEWGRRPALSPTLLPGH
jgi:hypothetical protein